MTTFLSKRIPNPRLAASAPHCPWWGVCAPALHVSGFKATVRQRSLQGQLKNFETKDVVLNGSILGRHCEKIFNFLQLNEKGVTLISGEAQAGLISQKTSPTGGRFFLSQNNPCHMLPTRLTESGGGSPGNIKAYAVTWNMGWRSLPWSKSKIKRKCTWNWEKTKISMCPAINHHYNHDHNHCIKVTKPRKIPNFSARRDAS